MTRLPMARMALLLALASVVTLAVPAAAGPSRARAASEGASLAHVRVEVTTTSSWAIVKIDDGWILASETRSADNASVTNNFSALRVDREVAGTEATATVDLVVDTTQTHLHQPNTHPVTVRLAKAGAGGAATAALTNLNVPSRPAAITTLHHPGPGSAPEQVREVSAADFFSTRRLELPRGTDEPRVIAAYYPWFSDAEGSRLTSYDSAELSDRPLKRRALDDAADVAAEVHQASLAGVDGFTVEFGSTHRQEFAHVADAAATAPRPFVVSGLLSAKAAAGTDHPAGTMLQWMRDLHAESRAAGDAYHRTDDGRPIVFIWGTEFFTPEQWGWFLQVTRDEGLDFAIVHDGAPETYQTLFDGHFRYGLLQDNPEFFSWWWARDAAYLRAQPLLDGTTPPLLVTTVSPGHDDCQVREPCTVIDRKGTRRYVDTWQRALSVDPDIVLVTSWNEWFESTSIAPSEDFGGSALAVTRLWSLLFHAS